MICTPKAFDFGVRIFIDGVFYLILSIHLILPIEGF